MEKSKVYFTREITPQSLIRIYDALGVKLQGKVAVKISTGEPGGHNFLNPNLIKDLVNKIDGTIVECCTAYRGKRFSVEDHLKTFKDHGFTAIAPCDLLDEEGDVKLPVANGKHLKGYDIVGSHILNYDSTLILSHFKGHQMGGFGGALKNISIGFATRNGKAWIHSVGQTVDPDQMMRGLFTYKQTDFLESMAEACEAVINHFGKENMLYINVANNLSTSCDCDANPPPPVMADLGIFASTDPVALDQACYDAVVNSDDPGKKALIERMDSRSGLHTVEEAERLGLGSRKYELVNID